ncbi:MAG: SCO family protein [Pseudomonadota bacterium]
MAKNRSAVYVGLLLVAAASTGYIVARSLHVSAPQLASGTALPQARPVAAFSLTDQDGVTFNNARLAGGPNLLFFGFTHCPDVCPTTLALMTQLHREAGLQNLRMIFVTVDPARDDALTLRHYVEAFGGGFTALRGEDAQLDPLLLNLGAVRSVQPLAGGDYAVDHSATLYFINSRGALSAVFTPPFDYARLRADLLKLVSGR